MLFELLSARGRHLQRLLPVWPGGRPEAGSFAPAELARYLIAHQRLLLIGCELAGQSTPILDAGLLDPGQRIRYADLQAVYVVGRAAVARPLA